MKESVSVRRLADEELIGSKTNALLVRTPPRDIYDVYNLFKKGSIINEILIRKIAIFYVCLGSEIPLDFNSILCSAIRKTQGLTYQRVKVTLIPVLHKKHTLNITEISEYVSKKIQDLFCLDKNDEVFIAEFNNKRFSPDILFDGFDVNDVSSHPMGLWKTKQATD